MNQSIRPPMVLEVSDPEVGLTGWLAVDSMIDDHFCGGLRMLPDVSPSELTLLARAMTLKHGFLGLPHGGAKAGIVCEESTSKGDKLRLLAAFGRKIESLLRSRAYLPGSDMGTKDQDIRDMLECVGIRVPKRALRGQKSGWYTSLTVVAGAKAACISQGFDLAKATVAIEGFGEVGSSVARGLHELGSKVVAVSTSRGALYSMDGLDLPKLLDDLGRHGRYVVDLHECADRVDKESLLELRVDVLMPCARHHSIHMDNVEKIKAKVISSGANAPVIEEAEKRLSQRNILCIPDFVSNSGGVLGGTMEFAGLNPSAILRFVDKDFSRQVLHLIDRAYEENVYIRELAERIATERFEGMKGASATRSVRNRVFSLALDAYRNGLIPSLPVGMFAKKYFRKRIEGKL